MASVSDEIPPTQNNEMKLLPFEDDKSVGNDIMPSNTIEQQQQMDQPSTLTPDKSEEASQDTQLPCTTYNIQEEMLGSTISDNINNETNDSKSQEQHRPIEKSRSVNFDPIIEEIEPPNLRSTNSSNARSRYTSSKTARRPVDFIDTLVQSYKLETSTNGSSIQEEKKYVPKTHRSRLNPNWREHRTRHLMNKLEELSLWDREEELKAAQAQALREQKWEQIQDRQRNHDLCLNLMRQRHESEMESAILLDRAANMVNDENKNATIARAMSMAPSVNALAYDLPMPPSSLKRRIKQEQDSTIELKTPIGRYRQFETTMDNKLDKLNQKLKPDVGIMRAYSPYRTSIPATTTPLFSETYSALLSVPDTYSSNKYNQYHYGIAPHLHQASQHASSPDYEARLRSYSNRDVRVPLKEQANDYNYLDEENFDENNRSKYIDYDHYTKYRSNQIENDYQTKYRSNPTENDYQTKYRSNPTENDYQTKYRSNPIENDYYAKYRSISIEPEYQSKYRSTSIEPEYQSKYRSNQIEPEYQSKYRSYPIEPEYQSKYRSNPIEPEYQSKYRSNPIDDELITKYRSNPIDDELMSKYRSNPIDDEPITKHRANLNDNDYYTKYRSALSSTLDYSPPRRTTSMASPTASALYDLSTVTNTPREFSFIHSRQPTSTSVHLRSLNDDLNAITRFSTETSKKILQNIIDVPNEISSTRSLTSTKKNVTFPDDDFDNDTYTSRHYSSKTTQQPVEILSLSATR